MSGDFNEKFARARAAPKSAESIPLWRELLTAVNVEEEDYKRVCTHLLELYTQPAVKRLSAAAAIREYLREWDGAADLYRQLGNVRDQARLHTLRNQHAEAMNAFLKAGMTAHAAASAELAGAHGEARSLWMQMIRPADLQNNQYVGALARFNVGRAAKALGDDAAASTSFFEAMDLLGREADARETDGDRDGALRCFQIMVAVGRAAAAFEDISEGYLNCARLLRIKGDRFGTIQALSELIRSAQELGELHAAAELYREAGDYARRMGFIYADHFLMNAGHAWKRVAQEGMEKKRPVSLVESGLLAAVDAYSRTLDHAEVARCYQALAALDVTPNKRDRYQRLATELSQVSATRTEGPDMIPTLPDYFRRKFGGAEYWIRDLLEREGGVDIHVATSRLLADQNVWDVGRRRALNLFLAFDDHLLANGPHASPPPSLLMMVGESNHPTLVPPLMEAFRRGSVEQKSAAVVAASRMKLKEACSLVDSALSTERTGDVYRAGLQALRGLTFPNALDSLVRMFSNHDAAEVKEAAVKNIALIGTAEAAEFLLDVVRSNTAGLGNRAREALMAHATEKMQGVFDNHKRSEPDVALRQFIAGLGARIRSRRDVVMP